MFPIIHMTGGITSRGGKYHIWFVPRVRYLFSNLPVEQPRLRFQEREHTQSTKLSPYLTFKAFNSKHYSPNQQQVNELIPYTTSCLTVGNVSRPACTTCFIYSSLTQDLRTQVKLYINFPAGPVRRERVSAILFRAVEHSFVQGKCVG
jgi:hypothetical protein